jgi:hypothetical protein
MHTVGAVGFMNVGVQLGMGGLELPAQAAFGTALLFTFLTVQGLTRAKRLDKFEREIKG